MKDLFKVYHRRTKRAYITSSSIGSYEEVMEFVDGRIYGHIQMYRKVGKRWIQIRRYIDSELVWRAGERKLEQNENYNTSVE